jgi:tripartite-type tricarboxylate transporter receptor subunit TctC
MAQGYPTKPVKFIVPYAAGGLPDSVARVVAQRLTERLGQSVVVDNKPGGNGVVAYQALLQSSPQDGHAFIVSDGSMLSITPLLNKAVPYKVGTDILPVSLIARSPLFVVAHPKNGVNTLQEFVSLVKRKPGEYTYGSSGIGSTHHLTMESMKASLGLEITHIPFKGTGQSVPALVGGQVDMLFSALPSLLGFVKSGQVRLLGNNAAKRSAQEPNVPAIAETIPGFDFAPIIAVFAATGTPAAAIERISSEMAAIAKMPEVVQTLSNAGIEAIGGSAAECHRAVLEEVDRLGKAVAQAGIQKE